MSTGKKGQIESDKVLIRDVFSRFWFSIPAYQRSYVWGRDEISELIDDVNYASKHNSEGQYFLGSMVLRKASSVVDGVNFDEHELLDGQQRLTTLYLLLACIRDEVADDELKATCRKMLFQKENTWENIPGRNRIVYKIRDNVGGFIERFVKPEGGTHPSAALTTLLDSKNLSLSNMSSAINVIRECFSDRKRFQNSTDFARFTKYLFNNVLFIYVSTEDLDDAFRLFTILNDRGIPLSNSDILKARNLGELSSEKDADKWATFWEVVEGELGRDEFDRFLSFIRTIYVKDKAREGLLKEFDERIYGAKPPLLKMGIETFEAVKEYKTAYDEAVLFNPLPPGLGNEYRNRITVMTRGLPGTDWVPSVLAWHRKFNSDGMSDFLRLVENKFSADWILQFTPTQRIQNMNDVLKQIESAATPGDVLASNLFGYDIRALIDTVAGSIYGRRYTKYVLLRLEHLYFNHTSALNLPDDISVEHLLPQNPATNSQWNIDFVPEQRDHWLHRLGNLTLLSRRKNTSLSNLEFIEKKNRYFKNNIETLPNSVRVLNLPGFDVSVVGTRHEELLATLKKSYEV